MGSITNCSAFYGNLRKTTRTSWLLPSSLLIAPEGQMGTILTFLRSLGWSIVCVCVWWDGWFQAGCYDTSLSPEFPPISCRTPAIVSCWATASKPKTPMGKDLGPTGWHGVKHLVDGTSEASQAPPELCILFAFGIITIQALERPSTHCPDLV